MNAEMIALAQRVAESEHFRWAEGMSDDDGSTILRVEGDHARVKDGEYNPPATIPLRWMRAILITDDATAGCIYRQACTRWECDWIAIRSFEGRASWVAMRGLTDTDGNHHPFDPIPGLCAWKQAAAEALAWKETTP